MATGGSESEVIILPRAAELKNNTDYITYLMKFLFLVYIVLFLSVFVSNGGALAHLVEP